MENQVQPKTVLTIIRTGAKGQAPAVSTKEITMNTTKKTLTDAEKAQRKEARIARENREAELRSVMFKAWQSVNPTAGADEIMSAMADCTDKATAQAKKEANADRYESNPDSRPLRSLGLHMTKLAKKYNLTFAQVQELAAKATPVEPRVLGKRGDGSEIVEGDHDEPVEEKTQEA